MTGLTLSRTSATFDMEQQVDGTWHLSVPHDGGSILVRPMLPGESLLPAFQLTYDIYVRERGLVAPEALPPDQRAMQAKWDRWDDLATTRHFIALHNGRVVGHMRLVDDSPLGLPIEHYGFDLTPERKRGPMLREISKLMIAKPYRGGGIVAAFYWHVFQTCRVQQWLPSVYLSCEPPLAALYRRIGGVEIGQFVNCETKSPFAAMRVDFVESYEKQFNGGFLGAQSKRRPTPIESTPGALIQTAA